MSGWRMALVGVVPVCGALLFLKIVADALATTSEQLRSFELSLEEEQRRRRLNATADVTAMAVDSHQASAGA